jgi:hypothetical protein
MGAEFIGLENIIQNLERNSFDGFSIYRGTKDKVLSVYANEEQTQEDLIECFEKWANDLLKSNPNNFIKYNIQLYETPEGARKKRGSITFSFQLVQAPSPFIKETEIGSQITAKELELSLKNQELMFRLERLEEKLEEQFEEEEEEEEEEKPSMLGAVESAIQEKMPQLIDVIIGMFMKPQQTTNFQTGIGSNIDQIISEFRLINPDIESDLLKLLNLAKTKPALFNMLITQLRSM